MNRFAYCILALSALLPACGEEPVRRHVQLAAEEGWPRAQTSYLNNSLRVEVTHMEPLGAGAAMNAWLHLHDGRVVRGGEVSAAAPSFLDGTALGVDWAQVHEVVITEESAGATPTAPSIHVLFRGAAGATLAAAVEGSITGLTATAELADGTLTLSAPSLPLLGSRMFYGIWLIGSHASGGAGAGATFVGRTYVRGTVSFSNLGATALRHEVAVTVESESGADSPTLSAVILRGVVPTSAAAPTSAGSAPAEAEAPSHVH